MSDTPTEPTPAPPVDPELLGATVQSVLKSMLPDALAPLSARLEEIAARASASPEKPDAAPADGGDDTGADGALAALTAKIEEIAGRLDAADAAAGAEKSKQARTDVLLKERPGFAGRPLAIERVVGLAAGDDAAAVLAAADAYSAEIAESGGDPAPFGADFKAGGGEPDAGGGDEKEQQRQRVEKVRQQKNGL